MMRKSVLRPCPCHPMLLENLEDLYGCVTRMSLKHLPKLCRRVGICCTRQRSLERQELCRKSSTATTCSSSWWTRRRRHLWISPRNQTSRSCCAVRVYQNTERKLTGDACTFTESHLLRSRGLFWVFLHRSFACGPLASLSRSKSHRADCLLRVAIKHKNIELVKKAIKDGAETQTNYVKV